jgi:hypothetical protein
MSLLINQFNACAVFDGTPVSFKTVAFKASTLLIWLLEMQKKVGNKN